MRRKAFAALLLVAGAVGAGAFAVGSQSQSTATVRSLEVTDSECDDGSYRSRIEQRPADGGTRVVVEDIFVGPAPGHGLDAAVAESSGNYTLTLTAQDATTTAADSRDCTGKLHYRAVVFVPAEQFNLTVVHGEETHVVLASDESSSWSGSESAAQGSTATATPSATMDTTSATTDARASNATSTVASN